MALIKNIIQRDLMLSFKRGSGTFNLVVFFIITASLFPFGVAPEVSPQIGAGVIWVCALLSSMLSLYGMYEDDYNDGSLAQIFLTGDLPEKIIIAKIISHWLTTGLPLVIISPLIAMLYTLDNVGNLVISLLIGTAAISCLGSIGAALTIGLNRASGIIAIIILPLNIPLLIFGTEAASGMVSALWILSGLLLFVLPISILSSTFCMKIVLEE